MSSKPQVALAGVGALGTPVLNALLDNNYPVTVFTRSGSKSKDSLPTSNPLVTIAEVDYNSLDSLKAALAATPHYAVVSTIGTSSLDQQQLLLEAAAESNVQRFLPSEFGSDSNNPKAAALPIFAPKIAIVEKAKELAKANPDFSWTAVCNNAFLDWGLDMNFLLNPKERTANIFDGGDIPFSVTRLSSVAEAVVGVLEHPEETKNRHVYIQDMLLTQNQFVKSFRKVDPEHREWALTQVDTSDLLKQNLEILQTANGDMSKIVPAMYGFLPLSMYADGYGGNFSDRLDNGLLGVKGMTSTEFEEFLKAYV